MTSRRALAAANAPVLADAADHLPRCASLSPLAHRIHRAVVVVSHRTGDEIGGERAGPVYHRASIARSQADLLRPHRCLPLPSGPR